MSSPTQMRDLIKVLCPPWLQDDSPPSDSNAMGISGRQMYVLGLSSDGLLEKMAQAMQAHMPGVGTPSALPFIGADRVMFQGPGQSDVAFALQLQSSFQTWQYAGSNRGVLQLIADYLSNNQFTSTQTLPLAMIVGGYKAQKWAWLNNTGPADGASTYYEATQNWSWDGLEATKWWREWVILNFERTPISLTSSTLQIGGPAGAYCFIGPILGAPNTLDPALPLYATISGAASAGNNGTFQVTSTETDSTNLYIANANAVAPDANDGSIHCSFSHYPALQPMNVWGGFGSSLVWGGNTNCAWGVMAPGTPNSFNTPAFFTSLRTVIGTWKGAQTWVERIILRFTGGDLSPGTEFSPWSSEGSGNPDGTWGHWGHNVAGVWVPARVTNVQFSAFDGYVNGMTPYMGYPLSFRST